MLTKTLSESKKKQRNILIKAMNNDIGSIDSAKDSWNPAQISERAKDISYIKSLVDTWNPAQLNEALRMLDLPVIDTWNPAQIEEQRRNLVFYLAERSLTGDPITLNILGNLTSEVTGLKVTMNPIQDLKGYDYPWAGGTGKNKFVPWSYTGGGLSWVNDNNKLVITVNSTNIYAMTKVFEKSLGEMEQEGIIVNGHTYTAKQNGENQGGLKLQLSNGVGGGISDLLNGYTFTYNSSTMSAYTFVIRKYGDVTVGDVITFYPQLEEGSTATEWTPYSNICPISGRTEVNVTRTAGEDVETKTHQYSETIYGGVDDFMNGGATSEWGYIASYDGETLPGEWISDRDVYAPDTSPTEGAEVVYKLSTPTTISTSAEDITLLKGTNVLSTDGDSIELKYKQNF